MSNTTSVLLEILTSRFNASEIKTLCFHLKIDYETLPGTGKQDKARELIAYLERRDQLSNLFEALFQYRPDLFHVTEFSPLYRIEESKSSLKSQQTQKAEPKNELPIGYTADTGKIVTLLISESLYSRDDTSVREIVQNAVDACERRRVNSRRYVPKIVVRIDSQEGWFEVDDNGEGMNAELLRNSFAVIGKSIRHDEVIISQMQLAANRLHLIAQFGIGFISVFRIAQKAVISTSFEGSDQINFSIELDFIHFRWNNR